MYLQLMEFNNNSVLVKVHEGILHNKELRFPINVFLTLAKGEKFPLTEQKVEYLTKTIPSPRAKEELIEDFRLAMKRKN